MKTSVITLQGQDFVMTEPARQVLMAHLKKLQRSTRFRPGSYRDNVEALRDVLLERGGKSVSKAKMTAAIELVGMPDKKSLQDTFRTRFPRLYRMVRRVTRPAKRLAGAIRRHWWQSLAVIAAFIAVFMSVGSGFSALMALQPTHQSSGWSVITTTIGPVRSYSEPTTTENSGWLFGWRADVLYSIVFLAIAILVLRLRRPGRLPFALALFGCGVVIMSLHFTQKIFMPDYATGANVPVQAQPLQPRMAYLQQCGDEIQYNSTDGMLFRQLRDQGFQLSAVIPTRESDGTIDVGTLCVQYDNLRRDHSAKDIVLQYYSRNDDGSIRAYDYTDLGEGRASYGLFVKS
jgi:hypothetical protein